VQQQMIVNEGKSGSHREIELISDDETQVTW